MAEASRSISAQSRGMAQMAEENHLRNRHLVIAYKKATGSPEWNMWIVRKPLFWMVDSTRKMDRSFHALVARERTSSLERRVQSYPGVSLTSMRGIGKIHGSGMLAQRYLERPLWDDAHWVKRTTEEKTGFPSGTGHAQIHEFSQKAGSRWLSLAKMKSKSISEKSKKFRMNKILQLARPQFLLASLVLFIMGAAWAIILGAEPGFWKLLWGYLIVFCAQLSVSFSNDYFDAESDRYGDPSLFAGGSGILVKNPEMNGFSWKAAVSLICFSLFLGFTFTIYYGYPFWFFGLIVIGNLLGWYYAAPPVRLSSRGLGEISTCIIAGTFLPGMGYLAAAGTLDGNGFVIMIPLLLIGLAFILSVEIPDMEADQQGGKWTWVARKGRAFGFRVVGILLLAVAAYYFLVPGITAQTPAGQFPNPWPFLPAAAWRCLDRN